MNANLHILHCIGRRTECVDGISGADVTFSPNFINTVPKNSYTFTPYMKKILVFILAVFYLGTSVGATVNLHYCMGRLVNWDLSHSKKRTEHNQCKKCGMEKAKAVKGGCCEDKYKVLQGEKDQKAESAYKSSHPVAVAAVTTSPSFLMPVVTSVSEEHPVSNAPPRCGIPARIRYCVFRI